MLEEITKLIIYSLAIVLISKYILSETIRRLAQKLELKPKLIGDITGISTSIPELLMVVISSVKGLVGASIYNVLSSNIINLMQYLITIGLNRNTHNLRNAAIKADIVLVAITILIPITIIKLNIELNLSIIPLFVILFIFFIFLNYNTHRVYLNIEEKELKRSNMRAQKEKKDKILKISKYSINLLFTTMLLFLISTNLGNVLESLCFRFKVSEIIVGILLGVITSLPELVTFFEAQSYNKKESNNIQGVIEATNNLLTSNILNLFIIQAIGIFIRNIV